MSLRLGKRTRREPPLGMRRRGLGSRVRALETVQNKVRLVNNGAVETRLSSLTTMHSFAATTVTVGSGVVAVRFTNIAQGDAENEREGNHVVIQRVVGKIELIWLGLLPALAATGTSFQLSRHQRVQVRMMLVQVFDETDEDSSVNGLAPTLVDIIANTTAVAPALGTFPSDDAMGALAALNDSYRNLGRQPYAETAALDRARIRQREFKVWWDKKVNLDWDHPTDGQIQDAAFTNSAYQGGVRASNTDAQVGPELAERFLAKKMLIDVNVPMNCNVEYLEATTQPSAEVKGNLYLYVFSSHGGTLGQNMTFSQWPTNDGTALVANTYVPQVVWRYRFHTYFTG